MKPTEVLIAKNGQWTLFDVANRSINGWRNFHLTRDGKKMQKKSWWLGWNDGHLARNRDMLLLAQHHEDVLGWVREVLEGGAT